MHLPYNKTSIDSYLKINRKQQKLQRMAWNLCHVEHVLNTPSTIRTIQYLGIPVAEKDIIMWGNNKSQVHSVSWPHKKLHKRHNNILSCYFVKSKLSQQYINLMHIKSKNDYSDLLTNHWGYSVVWKHILQHNIFHYSGNTGNLMDSDTLLVDTSIYKTKVTSLFDNKHGEYERL